MSQNAHDPPATPVTYQQEPPIPEDRLAVLHVPRHATYALMRSRLNREPLEWIRLMKHGGYRYKCKRGYPGVLVLDREGNPVPERMSFRQIAPILSALSGVMVTYETVRRWWEAVFPGEPDEPEDETPVPVVVPVRRRTAVRRKPAVPPVGDGHAEAIRAATERAKSTNPEIPAAAFLAPEV